MSTRTILRTSALSLFLVIAACGGHEIGGGGSSADLSPPLITLLGDSEVLHLFSDSYVDAGATAFDDQDGHVTDDIVSGGSVDEDTPDIYVLTYDLTDSDGNAADQVIRTVTVYDPADPNPPVITLLGDSEVLHELSTPYVDAGATAFDAPDGDLTDDIVFAGSVDVDATGIYVLTYDVMDSDGNAADQVIRTVTVYDPADLNPPVITLLGDSEVLHEISTPYVDAGATAFDDEDGDVTDDLLSGGSVDEDTPGIYLLSYDVTDSDGNAADQVIRTVTVYDPADPNPPVITLLGDSEVLHEISTPYVDAGATAFDDKDGDVTDDIVFAGSVDADVTGIYVLSYDVTDSDDNAADQVIRTITVYDPGAVFSYSDPFFLGTASLDTYSSSPLVGGIVATYSIEPDLPEGITLDADTGVISGTPTAKSERTTYTVIGVNDTDVGIAEVVIEVAAPARFAYAANSDERTISILRCDPDSGRLFPLSYHFMTSEATGSSKGKPQHLRPHPSGDWLLATTNTDGLIVYAVDPADGSLTYTSAEPLGSGGPHPLVVSSEGATIHVGGSGANPLRTFAFDVTTGALIPVATIATSPIHDLALSHDGTRLVTLDRDSELVRSWSVDTDGTPTQLEEYLISSGDAGEFALSRDGSSAYVALTGLGWDYIVRLSIDANGLITDEEGRPGPTGSDLVVLHPDEGSLFVASTTTHEVRRFPVDVETGVLDVLDESETTGLGALSDLHMGRAGRWMHAADVDAGELDLIAIDADTGSISAGASARVRLGAQEAPVIVRGDAVFSIDPLTLYVSCGSSATIDAFEIDSTTGLLTFSQTTLTQAEPRELLVGRSNDRLYVANYGNDTLSTFEVQSDGKLGVELDSLRVSAEPVALALEPSGRFLYANSVNAEHVFGYAIDALDGTLNLLPDPGAGIGVNGRALEADPTGRFLYCVSTGEPPFGTTWENGGNPGVVTVLQIDADTGQPVPLDDTVPGTVLLPFAPTSMTFDSSGARAYTNQTDNGIPHYAVPLDVAHADGQGTVVTPGTPTGDVPTAIEIGTTGRFGWVATSDGLGGGELKLYDILEEDDIDPSSGNIMPGSLGNSDTFPATLEARETYLDVSDPIALDSDASERWLYVLDSGSQTIAVWEIDATDGTLTKLDELATSTDPQALHLNESL